MAKKKEDGQEGKAEYQKVIDRLNTLYGSGTVIAGNDMKMDIESVSTGSISIDHMLNIWGLPRGRIIEVFGPESCGKTTMCLHVIANAQKKGIRCAYIDMEHALSGQYATDLQVNMNDLIFSQPMFGESAMEIAHQLIKSDEVGLIVIDSVASLVPKAEVESGIGSPKMAGIGRLMSEGLRLLSPLIEHHNCMVIFTNQIRQNPGGMVAEEPAGGKSLRFYASIRIDMRRVKNDKEEELSRTKVKLLKSKVGKPFQECEVDLVWGKGFGKMGEIVDLAEELEIIKRSGSWYSQGDTKLGQGRNAIIELLETNSDMAIEWEKQIIGKLKGEPIEEILEVKQK